MEPTDAHKNRVIAEAIDVKRKGWPWRDHDSPRCVMGSRWPERNCDGTAIPCPTCSGAGRVPVELHTSEYTLRLVEWYGKSGLSPRSSGAVEGAVIDDLGDVAEGGGDLSWACRHIRDIIYEELLKETDDG